MKNKKTISILVACLTLFGGVSYAENNLQIWKNTTNPTDVIREVDYPIYVNGQELFLQEEEVVVNKGGRTYLPARKIAEAVGADKTKMWGHDSQGNPYVNIVTPEHSKPTDYIQNNILPNGETVKHALETTPAIDAKARQLCQNANTKQQKALILYNYIIAHLQYVDMSPAVGAKSAFYTGKGICYDYAALYAVMCDAVDLNVRLKIGVVTKIGGHAWNQVQLDNGSWINVDTTWGEHNYNFGFKEYDLEIDGEVDYKRYPLQIVAEFESY